MLLIVASYSHHAHHALISRVWYSLHVVAVVNEAVLAVSNTRNGYRISDTITVNCSRYLRKRANILVD